MWEVININNNYLQNNFNNYTHTILKSYKYKNKLSKKYVLKNIHI